MAEMLVQSENLVAIADKIRVLSGTSGAMGLDAMATHVNTANSNVSTEAGLIAQIQTALEGKAAGGGSGGGSVETCTVRFVNNAMNTINFTCIMLTNSFYVQSGIIGMWGNDIYENVVCNSTCKIDTSATVTVESVDGTSNYDQIYGVHIGTSDTTITIS